VFVYRLQHLFKLLHPTKFNFSVQAGDEVNPELVDKLAGGHALPTLTLTAPKTGDVYSKLVPVSYTSTSTNQVIVYYSTTLADWSGEAIWPNDRVLIAQHLPTKGHTRGTQAKCKADRLTALLSTPLAAAALVPSRCRGFLPST